MLLLPVIALKLSHFNLAKGVWTKLNKSVHSVYTCSVDCSPLYNNLALAWPQFLKPITEELFFKDLQTHRPTRLGIDAASRSIKSRYFIYLFYCLE